jgi:hypothetical protein
LRQSTPGFVRALHPPPTTNCTQAHTCPVTHTPTPRCDGGRARSKPSTLASPRTRGRSATSSVRRSSEPCQRRRQCPPTRAAVALVDRRAPRPEAAHQRRPSHPSSSRSSVRCRERSQPRGSTWARESCLLRPPSTTIREEPSGASLAVNHIRQ